MKITKIGHCCLILEQDGVRIMTDPGSFTTEQVKPVTGIDIILITHEHQDHFHVPSIHEVLKNNPGATLVSNSAVAKLLAAENVPCTVVGDTQSTMVKNTLIEGYGKEHAPVYGPMAVENTGYMVAGQFYFPGDSFHNPGRSVDVLALPVAGPWMKISEAIDFAKAIKPRTAFGVHDGMIVPGFGGFVGQMVQNFLKADGTEFFVLAPGEPKEF